MRDAMPAKISDFTGNMQTLVERGEVQIGVQWEGECYRNYFYRNKLYIKYIGWIERAL